MIALYRRPMARRPGPDGWQLVAAALLAIGFLALTGYQVLRACLTPPDPVAALER